MRILVVSDIHANWPALAAIDEPHDFCLCLGDLVDYGPDPARLRPLGDGARRTRSGATTTTASPRGSRSSGERGYRYLTRVTRPLMWEALGRRGAAVPAPAAR